MQNQIPSNPDSDQSATRRHREGCKTDVSYDKLQLPGLPLQCKRSGLLVRRGSLLDCQHSWADVVLEYGMYPIADVAVDSDAHALLENDLHGGKGSRSHSLTCSEQL